VWVEGLDQCYFLGSAPTFDFFLAGNCGARAAVRFKPNELGHIVLLGEARNELRLVLENTLSKVTRHTEVEHTRFASHEIDVKVALHRADCFTSTPARQRPVAAKHLPVIPNGAGRLFLPLHFL